MTLKEIAQKAGVSVTTVSKIINSPDSDFARKEVRERVRKIAAEGGYFPNAYARQLRRGETGAAKGRILLYLGGYIIAGENPSVSMLRHEVERQARNMNYEVKVMVQHNTSFVESFINSKNISFDGAIIYGSVPSEIVTIFEKKCRNVVLLRSNLIKTQNDQVMCDIEKATKESLEYLFLHKHREIAFVGDTAHSLKYTYYKDFLQEFYLPLCPQYVLKTSNNEGYTYQAITRMLTTCAPLPTALLCESDIMAVEALQCLHAHGYKVPEDISILAICMEDRGQMVDPPLTSMVIPKDDQGSFAVKLLVDRIEKGHNSPITASFSCKLIVRSSVKML